MRHFFDLVSAEAGSDLQSLFVEDAVFHRPNQPPSPAVMSWLRRFASADYTHQVRGSELQIQLMDQRTTVALEQHRAIHLTPQAGEVLAVVALPPSPAQVPPLWGTEMQALLTWLDGAWRIRELWEDYPGK